MESTHEKTEAADVPEDALHIIDPQILQKLPDGTRIKSITPHGSSFWTRTACIHAESRSGQPVRYFLKITSGDRGRDMVLSEFTVMTALHALQPTLVPAALAWGSYEVLPGIHFLLCAFRELRDALPDVDVFPRLIAQLHREGAEAETPLASGAAPASRGRFGFHLPTFHGNVSIHHGWSDTWEEYFTRTTRALLERALTRRTSDDPGADAIIHADNEQIQQLAGPFFDIVVPRLLRPMETSGRTLRPTLIHGDLWHGNTAVDADTGIPVIFDAASFYAHNEYELAVWRQPWNRISEPYRARYRQCYPATEPEEDFEDRGMLYATRVNILDSILYVDDPSYRQMLLHSMRTLVNRFAGSLDLDHAAKP